MKRNKGITLIALVITIIVLLILAGVAIAMLSGQNGILKKAADAKTETEHASELERVKLVVQSVLTDGKGTVDLTKLEEELQQEFKNDSKKPTYQEGKITLTNGDIYKVTTSGRMEKAITFKKQGTGELVEGDEVIASNGEKFYVIGFSDDKTNVNLLAKYNLKKEGTEITLKQDTEGASNACAFSSICYWSDATDEQKADLSKLSVPVGVKSIMTTAKEYGDALGVAGRLMTYEEAGILNSKNLTEILYGNKDGSKLSYWLGSADSDNINLHGVDGDGDTYTGICNYDFEKFGSVRPVIEVLASSIK